MISIAEKEELLKRVDRALDEVRPHLAVDGGNIEVVDITDSFTVQVLWKGNCVNCSMSEMTMKAGVEMAIKARVPEIKGIEAINGLSLS
jgi:Fe-S cluster biogenesis protein NfuA